MYHSHKKVSINDFDQKLAEVDAYLQLLIEHTEKLDKKIELAASDQERDGLITIKNNSDNLLGSIKHAIVLLQIAKVTVKALPLKSTVSSDSPTSSSSAANISISSPANSSSSPSNLADGDGSTIKAPLRKKDKHRNKDKQRLKQQQAASQDISGTRHDNRLSRFTPQSSSELASDNSIITANNNRDSSGKLFHYPQYRHSIATDQALVDNSSNCNSAAATTAATVAAAASSSLKKQLNFSSSNQTSLLITPHNNEQRQIVDVSDDDDDDEPFYDADDDTPTTTTTRENALHGHFINLKLSKELNAIQQQQITTNISNPAQTSCCSEINKQQQTAAILNSISSYHDNVDASSNINKGYPTSSQPSTPTHQQQFGTITPLQNHSIGNSSMEGSVDWESLYDEEEEDLGNMEEGNGSVIKHLLSQIRIGMDLTKVVLPTFILERRSLLEMYADFFAHPDLFSNIPDYKTPEERMTQVVRWYLSAFHAGRNSTVPKKPYNPILGEIFRCHWQLQEANNDDGHVKEKNGTNNRSIDETTFSADSYLRQKESNTCDLNDEFPRTLAKDSLIFVAEQVSHHPPVSAFYAENKAKRITCCAHVYTKSKYLGLSIGVNNIGHGTINLLDHNETYTCTFPSAFGRSILTIPWMELGGSVNIKCAQTQYSANIEFVTKPFYGGKKHRVLGEILRPNNEPYLNIDGEWNGVMYSKSTATGEKEIFVDTSSLPVIKKHVRPICTQETFESRNVWKEVTRALKLRDVTNATAAKTFIEQKQRESLKERQEKGVKWETRVSTSERSY